METPRIWNAPRTWRFSAAARQPEVFFLRDHITLLQDLVRDWTYDPNPPDVSRFLPTAYEFNVNTTDLKLRMCMNEHNVINQTNDLDENSELVPYDKRIPANQILIGESLLHTRRPDHGSGAAVSILGFHARDCTDSFSNQGGRFFVRSRLKDAY